MKMTVEANRRSGVTSGEPVKLNTDTTTRLQWQPNLSVSDGGDLLSVWYDERETTNCTVGNPAVPCYRMWARKSTDNGAIWLADMEFSDVVSPCQLNPTGQSSRTNRATTTTARR
jgi:hypothetical protein